MGAAAETATDRTISAPVRRSRVPLFVATVLAAVGAFIFAPLTPASAHDQLVDTVIAIPGADEGGTITLSYSNTLMDGATLVHVVDEAGQSVAAGDPVRADRDIIQDLEPLSPGTYSTAWSVVSSDGHRIEGGFAFTITDGFSGEAEVLPLSEMPGTDDDHDHGDEHVTDSSGFPAWGWAVIAVVVIGAAIIIPVTVRASRRSARDGAAASDSSSGSVSGTDPRP